MTDSARLDWLIALIAEFDTAQIVQIGEAMLRGEEARAAIDRLMSE